MLFFFLHRKVLIVMELTVLQPANEVMGKIGDPKPFNTDSAQQQPQQNGSGPQHNISGRFTIIIVITTQLFLLV